MQHPPIVLLCAGKLAQFLVNERQQSLRCSVNLKTEMKLLRTVA
jgi:hypothetical protein